MTDDERRKMKELYGSWGLTRRMPDSHFKFERLPRINSKINQAMYDKTYNTDLFTMRPIKVQLLKIINYIKNLIHSALTGEKYTIGGSK